MRVRILTCLTIVLCCRAQSPADLFSKAPPAVDQALRENVSKFYQAYVAGKFRAATQFVAEDSQDVFFQADKRRCHAFEIIRVDYSENFTRASVVVNCPTDVLMPPRGLTRLTMPLSSKWKVEEGKWFWYVPPRQTRDSPFGVMQPGPGGATNTQIPQGPSVADLMRLVTLDRNEIRVKIGSQSEEGILITNGMPGDLQLSLESAAAIDLKVRFESTKLKSKESGKMIVAYEPNPDRLRVPGMKEEIRIVVEPMHRLLPVVVSFEK